MIHQRLHALGRRHLRHGQPVQALQSKYWVQVIAAQLSKETTHGDARFYAAFSRQMRLILVDHARQKRAKSSEDRGAVLLRLHQALKGLEHHDPDAAHACQLYYFGGHTLTEIAILMGVTEAVMSRQIRFAKAWLWARCELS